MKKICTFLLFISIFSYIGYSQGDYPCDNLKNWDWTVSTSYDYAYVNGIGRIALSSPFHTTSSADQTLTDIISGKDYLPSEGWVLLRKVFGCPKQNIDTKFPHFILYNKYRGIIRLFIFNGSPFEYQKAVVTLSLKYGSDKTSLFAPSEVIQSPNKEYHDGEKVSNDIVNYIENYYSAAWFVTDIPVTFDHLLDYKKDFYIRITVNSSINSTIKLDSKFTIQTKSVVANAKPQKNGVYEFAKGTQDMISKVPTQTEFKKYFDAFNRFTGQSNGEKRLKETANQMNNSINNNSFQNFFLDLGDFAGKINKPIKAGLGLLNFFIGKSNKNAVSAVQLLPLVSNGEGTITGQISTTTNATSYPLQLPATNHRFQSNDINYDGLPIYDCPLGVISLEESPAISAIKTYSKNTESHSGFNFPIGDFWYYDEDTYYNELALSGAVILAHNVQSGTEIIDVQAQLIAKIPYPYNANHNRGREIYNRINDGEYLLLDIKNEENNKSYMYGTKIVDIEDLKNQRLVIPSYVNSDNDGNRNTWFVPVQLFLKVFIKMKPTDPNAGQTPIFYVATYEISGKSNKGFEKDGKTLRINRYFENCNCYDYSEKTNLKEIKYTIEGKYLKIQNEYLKNGHYYLFGLDYSKLRFQSGKLVGGDMIYLENLIPLRKETDFYVLNLRADNCLSVTIKLRPRE